MIRLGTLLFSMLLCSFHLQASLAKEYNLNELRVLSDSVYEQVRDLYKESLLYDAEGDALSRQAMKNLKNLKLSSRRFRDAVNEQFIQKKLINREFLSLDMAYYLVDGTFFNLNAYYQDAELMLTLFEGLTKTLREIQYAFYNTSWNLIECYDFAVKVSEMTEDLRSWSAKELKTEDEAWVVIYKKRAIADIEDLSRSLKYYMGVLSKHQADRKSTLKAYYQIRTFYETAHHSVSTGQFSRAISEQLMKISYFFHRFSLAYSDDRYYF